MSSPLTDSERQRYSRQIILPDLGETGQATLKQTRVLLVGSGALGSPAALYLAAAGIGHLVLIDPDAVELSNLHRQILHGTRTLGHPKTQSATDLLRNLNPDITITGHPVRLTPDNARQLAQDCHIIVDGCDNFPTRFLTNDLGFFERIPVVHGAIDRFQGQVSVFSSAQGGPCYRCLLPTLPPPGSVPSCQEAGVIGALPGIIGSMMAMETIKLALSIGDPLIGRLLIHDAWTSRTRCLQLRPDPLCRLCGSQPSIRSLHNPETTASATCSTGDIAHDTVTVHELQDMLRSGFDGLLIDVREPAEHAARHIDQAILIPLGHLQQRASELPQDKDIILHCKMGGRSAKALAILKTIGFTRVRHLTGGIDAWPL